VAPGRVADVNILRALDEPTPDLVFCRGRLVARQGALAVPAPSETFPWADAYAGAAPAIPDWGPELFLLPRHAPDPFPAASLVSAAITREAPVRLAARDGGLWPAEADCLTLAATDRHGRWITRGVLRNFAAGLDRLATTFSTNAGTLVLGRSPEGMAEALARLRGLGGGFALRSTSGDWYDFTLPMAGIHRTGGFAEGAKAAREFHRLCETLGYSHSDPKYSLVFLTCDFLPDLRATEAGWIRVKTEEVLLASEPV
jgi:adenine deaminase